MKIIADVLCSPVTQMLLACLQVTHLMRCSGTVTLAAAACSMDVMRIWGRYTCFWWSLGFALHAQQTLFVLGLKAVLDILSQSWVHNAQGTVLARSLGDTTFVTNRAFAAQNALQCGLTGSLREHQMCLQCHDIALCCEGGQELKGLWVHLTCPNRPYLHYQQLASWRGLGLTL